MPEQKVPVPVWEKFALTIKEATEYFGIGEKKLRKMMEDLMDEGLAFQNGTKVMIKRELFENFLNETSTI